MATQANISEYYQKLKTTFETQFNTSDVVIDVDNDPYIREFFMANAVLFAQNDESLLILQNEQFDHINWGNIFNISRNPASPSNGFVSFQGTAGATILQGTLLKSSAGLIYQTLTTESSIAKSLTITSISSDGAGTITVGTSINHNLSDGLKVDITSVANTNFNTANALVTVTGETTFTYQKQVPASSDNTGAVNFTLISIEIISNDKGANTILDRGSEIVLLSPISGIGNSGFVQYTKVLGGTDTESDDDYRSRIKEQIQNPITYYNDATIISTAKKLAGTTRVFVKGAYGETIVRHLRDNDPNPFPDAQANTNLKNYLLSTIYPVGYSPNDLNVSAPTPKSYTITIGYITTGFNDAQMQGLITTEIQNLFKKSTYEKPVSNISILSAINSGVQKDGRITDPNEYDLITNSVVINNGGGSFTDCIPVLGGVMYDSVLNVHSHESSSANATP